MLADLNDRDGRTIVMVLHDLNLACRYADHLVAMGCGTIVAEGRPTDIVDAALVAQVFGLDSCVLPDPLTGTPMVVPVPTRRRCRESRCWRCQHHQGDAMLSECVRRSPSTRHRGADPPAHEDRARVVQQVLMSDPSWPRIHLATAGVPHRGRFDGRAEGHLDHALQLAGDPASPGAVIRRRREIRRVVRRQRLTAPVAGTRPTGTVPACAELRSSLPRCAV